MKKIITFIILILTMGFFISCSILDLKPQSGTTPPEAEEDLPIVEKPEHNDFSKMTGFNKVDSINGKIKLDIFLDVNSMEVFINDGYYTMTANIYAPKDAINVNLFTTKTEASFSNLEKYKIIL